MSFESLPINDKTEFKVYEKSNLGEILTGEFKFLTNYEIKTLNNTYCALLNSYNPNEQQYSHLKALIDYDFRQTFYLDSLPSALNLTYKGKYDMLSLKENELALYSNGIPLGFKYSSTSDKYVFYNHLVFNVFYFKEMEDFNYKLNQNVQKARYSIVGFDVIPYS